VTSTGRDRTRPLFVSSSRNLVSPLDTIKHRDKTSPKRLQTLYLLSSTRLQYITLFGNLERIYWDLSQDSRIKYSPESKYLLRIPEKVFSYCKIEHNKVFSRLIRECALNLKGWRSFRNERCKDDGLSDAAIRCRTPTMYIYSISISRQQDCSQAAA